MDEGPQLFKTFVNRNRHKLPVVVQVQEGIYGDQELDSEVQDFSCGDYLQLQKLVEEVNVTFESFYDQPSHQGQITLPIDYEGNLEIQSRFPIGHVFPRAADVLKDCVTYVYPQLQFEAQDSIVVKPGDRLRVLKKVTLPKGDYLLCMLVREDRNVMVPFQTKGNFEKREECPECRLKDILDRLPQRVRILKDESMKVRGIGHRIEGLHEEYFGDLLLSKVEFVEACLWDSPGNIIKIPCSININVMAAPQMESQFGDACDIHALIQRDVLGTSTKVVIADDENKAEQLGLTMDTIFNIRDHRQEICALAETDGSFLLLPQHFEGNFMFITQEFKTAIDLLESNYKEQVRVTHAHVSADPRGDSLYHNDKVKIHAKELLLVPQIPNTSYEEHELILLDRHFSTQGHVGLVKVPTYALGCFQTDVTEENEFQLAKVLESELPQTVGFAGCPNPSSTECHLTEGKAVTFHGVHAFNMVYVSPDETNNNPNECIRVIPDFVSLKVRPLRPDLPKSKGRAHNKGPGRKETLNPLKMNVFKLEKEQFEAILSNIESAKDPSTGIYVDAVIEGNKDRKLPAPPPDDGNYDQLTQSDINQSVMSLDSQRNKKVVSCVEGYEKFRGQDVIPKQSQQEDFPPPIFTPSSGPKDGSRSLPSSPLEIIDVPPPIFTPSPGHRGGSTSGPSSPPGFASLRSETRQGRSEPGGASCDPESPAPRTKRSSFARLRRSISGTLPRMPFHFKNGTLQRRKKRSRSEPELNK
ncbi:uncharacterized protein [Amphiura filiformis]|uniref:uncharacterized protein n=1 Tax=Amphiura filiformis TaxID=82378 RepID=UPI003B2285F4